MPNLSLGGAFKEITPVHFLNCLILSLSLLPLLSQKAGGPSDYVMDQSQMAAGFIILAEAWHNGYREDYMAVVVLPPSVPY